MWRPFVCALGFLTRLPVPHVELNDAQVARSAAFFPWVGGLIAALLAGVAQASLPLGPALAAACVTEALGLGAAAGSGTFFGRRPKTATAAMAATKSRPTVTLVVRCMTFLGRR